MIKHLNSLLLLLSLSFVAIFFLPKLFGKTLFIPYIVTSGSMSPGISAGSAVFVTPASSYSPGDIISFKSGPESKTIITHRLIFTEPNYRTAGDANSDFDQFYIQPDQIIGKVFLSLPYLGYIANFTKTPQGFVLFVIVPATIIIYEELKSLFAQIRKIKIITPQLNVDHKLLVLIPVFFASMLTASLTVSYYVDHEVSIGSSLAASSQ